MPAIEVSEIEEKIKQRDMLKIDISKFNVNNIRTDNILQAKKVPEFMQRMLLDGGLIEYYKKY